jgi:hypothetical protein
MTHDFVLITACHPWQADLSRARTYLNGLLCVSISIDAEPPKKLQAFSGFFAKFEKNSFGCRPSRLNLDGGGKSR